MKQLLTLSLVVLYSILYSQGIEIEFRPSISGDPETPAVHPVKINLVILSDGYTKTEKEKFFSDAADFRGEFEVTSPFKEYISYFNFIYAFKESANSGVIHPRTTGVVCETSLAAAAPSTAFGSSLDNFGLHRGLTSNMALVTSFIENYFSGNTVTTIVFSNTAEWSGTANRELGIATISARYSINIVPGTYNAYHDEKAAIHEFGHSFGNLQDEYYFECPSTFNCTAYNLAPNRSANSDLSNNAHTWHQWYNISTSPNIGSFNHRVIPQCPVDDEYEVAEPADENYGNLIYGAVISDLFKPTTAHQCRMEKVFRPFCAVCQEALIEKIHSLVNPIATFTPSNVEPFTTEEPLFKLTLIEPDPSYMRVEWYFNDVLMDTDYGINVTACSPACGVYEWQFDDALLAELPNGCYHVKAMVYDMGGKAIDAIDRWIRTPNHASHINTVEWTYSKGFPLTTDLYMLDRSTNDSGEDEGYVFTWDYDEGASMWVRNEDDEIEEHQNPDFSSASGTEFVYVKVINKGCKTSAPSHLDLYTSLSATETSWNADWIATGTGQGYQIGTKVIPPISGNSQTILKFEWNGSAVTPALYATHNWTTCLLARIEDETGDPIATETPTRLQWDVWHNNNVTLKNVTVVEFTSLLPPPIINNRRMAPGAFVNVGNTSAFADTFNLQFDLDNDSLTKTLNEESEITVALLDDGYSVSSQIEDSMLTGLVRIDTNLFRVTSDHAKITGIPFPANTKVPAYIGFAFLTQEVTDTLNHLYHLSQYHSNNPDTVTGAQHFRINRVERDLFEADAGLDKTVLVNTPYKVEMKNPLSEDAFYNWYNSDGNLIHSGAEFNDSSSSTGTFTYKLEVIAESDGYKDYDEVLVTVKLGKITNIVPNPASSGTVVISYSITGVTAASIDVVEVSTSNTTNHSITGGTGTLNLDISALNTGSYNFILKGDGNAIDTKLFVKQ
jgi:hypothetical protein